MSLLDFFRPNRNQNPDLLEALLSAIESSNEKVLADLCKSNLDEIREKFKDWSTIPESIRKNPSMRKRHAEGLIAIAQFFESNGDSSLVSSLMREAANNPIVQWQGDLNRARFLFDSGQFMESAVLLEKIVSDNSKLLGGSAVDEYLPKTHGMLGAAYFRMGNISKATKHTQDAKLLCERLGDKDGAAIYERNLQHLSQHA